MDRRTFLVAATFAVAALATRPAFAGKAAVFTGLVDGVGVGGYDPVAYFTQQSAVPGDPAISAVLDGVTYRFASAEHRDAFLLRADEAVLFVLFVRVGAHHGPTGGRHRLSDRLLHRVLGGPAVLVG